MDGRFSHFKSKILVIFSLFVLCFLLVSCGGGKYDTGDSVSLGEFYYDQIFDHITYIEEDVYPVVNIIAGYATETKVFNHNGDTGVFYFTESNQDMLNLLWTLYEEERFCAYYDAGEFYEESSCYADDSEDYLNARVCYNFDMGTDTLKSCMVHEVGHILWADEDYLRFGHSQEMIDYRHYGEDDPEYYYGLIQMDKDYVYLIDEFYEFSEYLLDLIEISYETYEDDMFDLIQSHALVVLNLQADIVADGVITEAEEELFLNQIAFAESSIEGTLDSWRCDEDNVQVQVDSILSGDQYPYFLDSVGIGEQDLVDIFSDLDFCDTFDEGLRQGYDEGMDHWGHFFTLDWLLSSTNSVINSDITTSHS